ncbi:MAG: AMMECR1 domain-containing protein, partial [Bacteroidales bacterium]|nr:AMMECR1 domain-containing protein [Bacteroidales bacterium]
VSEIELGKHGVFMEKGEHSGVFLPQVASETGWSMEEFLGHCSRDKAGLGWEGWKTTEIYIFTATVFS